MLLEVLATFLNLFFGGLVDNFFPPSLQFGCFLHLLSLIYVLCLCVFMVHLAIWLSSTFKKILIYSLLVLAQCFIHSFMTLEEQIFLFYSFKHLFFKYNFHFCDLQFFCVQVFSICNRSGHLPFVVFYLLVTFYWFLNWPWILKVIMLFLCCALLC
jgi:hypothetical protein